MRLWTIFVHHFKREEELTISHWQRFTSHVKVEAEFPRSYNSVFARFFFFLFLIIVVLKNISFKNYSFHHAVHFSHDFKLISNT